MDLKGIHTRDVALKQGTVTGTDEFHISESYYNLLYHNQKDELAT